MHDQLEERRNVGYQLGWAQCCRVLVQYYVSVELPGPTVTDTQDSECSQNPERQLCPPHSAKRF
jgi:hypothetical protein